LNFSDTLSLPSSLWPFTFMEGKNSHNNEIEQRYLVHFVEVSYYLKTIERFSRIAQLKGLSHEKMPMFFMSESVQYA
jgi:hypothetical protein